MENNDLLDQGVGSQGNDGGLTSEDKGYLDTAAKWARFLGIVGFVASALFVVLGIGMMSMGSLIGRGMSDSPMMGTGFGLAMGLIYILLALPYFFISLYMYRFGVKTKAALYASSQEGMTEAFMNLRNFFRLMGILTAVILVIYGVILIFGIGAAALMGSRM